MKARTAIAAIIGALMLVPSVTAANPPLSLSSAHQAAVKYERAYWPGEKIFVRPCHWWQWHGRKARCRVDAPRMSVVAGQPPMHVVWHDIVGLRHGHAVIVAYSFG